MIKDRFAKEYKDFAFIEFYSIEEAMEVIRIFSLNPLKLQGKDLVIDFSKIKPFEEANSSFEFQVSYLLVKTQPRTTIQTTSVRTFLVRLLRN